MRFLKAGTAIQCEVAYVDPARVKVEHAIVTQVVSQDLVHCRVGHRPSFLAARMESPVWRFTADVPN